MAAQKLELVQDLGVRVTTYLFHRSTRDAGDISESINAQIRHPGTSTRGIDRGAPRFLDLDPGKHVDEVETRRMRERWRG
jgi:hypothetical protein